MFFIILNFDTAYEIRRIIFSNNFYFFNPITYRENLTNH